MLSNHIYNQGETLAPGAVIEGRQQGDGWDPDVGDNGGIKAIGCPTSINPRQSQILNSTVLDSGLQEMDSAFLDSGTQIPDSNRQQDSGF